MILWKPSAVGRHCSEVIKQRTLILNTKERIGHQEVNPWNEESISEKQRDGNTKERLKNKGG